MGLDELLAYLGTKYSFRDIASSIIFSILILFYILDIASFIQPDVYVIEERTTYHRYFKDGYIVSEHADYLIMSSFSASLILLMNVNRFFKISLTVTIALIAVLGVTVDISLLSYMSIASLPLFLSALVYFKVTRKENPMSTIRAQLVITYLLISSIILSVLLSLATFSAGLSELVFFYEIFVLLSGLSPLLVLFIFFIVPVRVFLIKLSTSFHQLSIIDGFKILPYSTAVSSKIMWLLLCVCLSVFIVICNSYFINQGSVSSVGIDTPHYVEWMKQLENSDPSQFIRNLFVEFHAGEIPFSLLFLYAVLSSIPGNIAINIDFVIPIILSSSLTVATFVMTKEITLNDRIAILSSFSTAVSFPFIVGMYGGLYANWISLLPAYLSLGLLFRVLRGNNFNINVYGLSLGIVSVVLLLSHVYTWTIYIILMSVYLVISGLLKRHRWQLIIIAFIALGSSIVADVIKMYFTTSELGIERGILLTQSQAQLHFLSDAWSNLVRTIQVYMLGLYSNAIVLALILFGSLIVSSRQSTGLLMLIFLSLGIVYFIFGDKVIMGRGIYIIPFQIPMSIALFWIIQRGRNKLLPLATIIGLVSIAIRQSANS